MSVELKIKSKHLAEEAKIIRFEERKLRAKNRSKFIDIQSHRRWNVRNENRATFLARAFLEGRPYKTVEQFIHSPEKLSYYIVPRVVSMVNKYGSDNYQKSDIENWIEA